MGPHGSATNHLANESLPDVQVTPEEGRLPTVSAVSRACTGVLASAGAMPQDVSDV